MVLLRRVWTILVGVLAGSILGQAVLRDLLGVDRPLVDLMVLACAVLGGIAFLGDARTVGPYEPHERYDVIVGWTALVGGVLAVACLAIPVDVPLRVAAAALVVVATTLLLRRVPAPPRPERERGATTLRAGDRQA